MANATLPSEPVPSSEKMIESDRESPLQDLPRSSGTEDYLARIDQLRHQARNELNIPSESNDDRGPRVGGFSLMLFLFGQVIGIWALACGHVGAMIIGLMFSITGATIGCASLYYLMKSGNRQPHLSPTQHVNQGSSDHGPKPHSDKILDAKRRRVSA